jgi:uncharacterized protein
MKMERRAAAELRATDKPHRLVGLAAVYDSPSQDLGGFVEVIRKGAFTRSLQSNVRDPIALVGHQAEKVIGRVSAGTLNLTDDSAGLRFEVTLPDTSAGRDLLVSVQRRDITGASFGFPCRAAATDGRSAATRCSASSWTSTCTKSQS